MCKIDNMCASTKCKKKKTKLTNEWKNYKGKELITIMLETFLKSMIQYLFEVTCTYLQTSNPFDGNTCLFYLEKNFTTILMFLEEFCKMTDFRFIFQLSK